MRIYYFDYLRFFLLTCAMMMFSSIAYSNIHSQSFHWYLYDSSHLFFDILIATFDVFTFPTLFFIAGFFTYKSYKKRDKSLFIKDKFLRVFLPFLFGVVVLNGYPTYVFYQTYTDAHTSFFYFYFVNYLLKITHIFQPTVAAIHLWGLGALFIVYLLYLLLRKPIDWVKGLNYKTIVIVYVLSIGIFYSLYHFMPEYMAQYKYLDFFVMQRFKLPFYGLCYLLGVWYYKNKNRIVLSYIPYLKIVSLLALIIYTLLFILLSHLILESFWIKLLFSCLYPLTSISIIISLTEGTKPYWEKQFLFLDKLSLNGYATYILQFNFLILIQVWLANFSTSPFVGFVCSFLGSFLMAYSISNYVLRRFYILHKILY